MGWGTQFAVRFLHLVGAFVLVGGSIWVAYLRRRFSGDLSGIRASVDRLFRAGWVLAVLTGVVLLLLRSRSRGALGEGFLRLLWWKLLLIGGILVAASGPVADRLASRMAGADGPHLLRWIEAGLWLGVAALGVALHYVR